MQNDFEKQVREKMDELRFVPTPPVWEKIELQIRRKKDRRRILFWLPLLVAGLGAAVWGVGRSGQGAETEKIAARTNGNEHTKIEKKQVRINTGAGTADVNAGVKKNDEIRTDAVAKAPVTDDDIVTTGGSHPVIHISPKVMARLIYKRNTTFTDRTIANKKNRHSSALPASFNNPSPAITVNGISSATNDINPLKSALGLSFKPTAIQLQPISDIKERLIVDTSRWKPIICVLPTNYGPPKAWSFGIGVAAGTSGVTSSPLSTEKSLDLAYANPTVRVPLATGTDPSTLTRHTYFEVGLVAERSLTNRLTFATGLGYSYFSTSLGKGQRFTSGRAVTTTNVVSSYNPSHGGSYINRFHFLTLPVALRLQPVPRLPLTIHAGLTARRLIASDALLYDPAVQVYYKDASVFRKTQLFSSIGIDYALDGRRGSWRAGPQLEYGLGRAQNDRSQHWYALGLRVQYLLHR